MRHDGHEIIFIGWYIYICTMVKFGQSDEASNTTGECFDVQQNHILIHYFPFLQKYPISVEQCKELCKQFQINDPRCRSFTYKNIDQSCDLFAKKAGDGHIRTFSYANVDYYQPTSNCNKNITMASMTKLPQPPNTTEKSIPTAATEMIPKPVSNSKVNMTRAVGPPGTQCPVSETARFSKMQGFKITQVDVVTMVIATELECAQLCSLNEITLPSGETTFCKTFDYEIPNQLCSISSDSRVPEGAGLPDFIADSSDNLKMCIDESRTVGCPLQVIRIPQKQLTNPDIIGKARNAEDCIRKCYDTMIGNERCRSGMFLIETNECRLSNVDTKKNPSYVKNARPETIIDYFDLGCV